MKVRLFDDGKLYVGVLCPVTLFLMYSLGFSGNAVNVKLDNL